METIVVDLTISADEYIKHYQVAGAIVAARCRDGRSVTFPANILQRFVMRDGIKGSFKIIFDEKGKFKQIEKV